MLKIVENLWAVGSNPAGKAHSAPPDPSRGGGCCPLPKNRTPLPAFGSSVWGQLRRTADQRSGACFLTVSRLKWSRTGCSRPLSSISFSLSRENWRPSIRRRLHASDTWASRRRQSSRSVNRAADMLYRLPSSGSRNLTVDTQHRPHASISSQNSLGPWQTLPTPPHPSLPFPRLRNDLYCVEWDVKLCYTIPSPLFSSPVSKF